MMTPWRFKVLGYPLGFAEPWNLLLSVASVVLLLWAVRSAFQRRARMTALLPERFVKRLAPGASRRRPLIQSTLWGSALFLWGIALAQPQCGTRSELTKKRGLDVVVALDASKSMLAKDVSPSRLERAKIELLTLLDELKGDRVGIVIFATDAFVQCPLTSDYEAAKMFLRAVDPRELPQGGTDVGGALRLSKEVLDAADRGGGTDRVVVLLSDGEDMTGDSASWASTLGEAGIQVLAVAIGSEGGEPIPEYDERGQMVGYKKDGNGNTVMTRMDRASLQRIVSASDGELFYRPSGVAMGDVVARIDTLHKGDFESRVTVRYDERFQPFALAGLILYVAALFISDGRQRRPA